MGVTDAMVQETDELDVGSGSGVASEVGSDLNQLVTALRATVDKVRTLDPAASAGRESDQDLAA